MLHRQVLHLPHPASHWHLPSRPVERHKPVKPEWNSPVRIGVTTVRVELFCDDPDAVVASALAAGATSQSEPADAFYGDRVAGVIDPSGNRWFIATRQEELSHEEMTRRAQSAGKAG